MGDFKAALKNHFYFSKKETVDIIISIIIVTFIFAFDDGNEIFSFASWFGNFLMFAMMVSLALIGRISVQKILAIKAGYRAEFKGWSYGLVIGGIFSALTNGSIILILPGGMAFHHMSHRRLGSFRYGLNYDTTGSIAAAGSIANMLFGMFAKALMVNLFDFRSVILDTFIYVNFLIAFYLLLPIPPLDGFRAFFGSRLTYVLIFGIIFGYVALFLMSIYSIIFAILIGAIVWIIYYFVFESKNW